MSGGSVPGDFLGSPEAHPERKRKYPEGMMAFMSVPSDQWKIATRIVMPVNMTNTHWYCMCVPLIDANDRRASDKIMIYDSLYDPLNDAKYRKDCRIARAFVLAMNVIHGTNYTTDSQYTVHEGPRQADGHTCALRTFYAARYYCLKHAIPLLPDSTRESEALKTAALVELDRVIDGGNVTSSNLNKKMIKDNVFKTLCYFAKESPEAGRKPVGGSKVARPRSPPPWSPPGGLVVPAIQFGGNAEAIPTTVSGEMKIDALGAVAYSPKNPNKIIVHNAGYIAETDISGQLYPPSSNTEWIQSNILSRLLSLVRAEAGVLNYRVVVMDTFQSDAIRDALKYEAQGPSLPDARPQKAARHAEGPADFGEGAAEPPATPAAVETIIVESSPEEEPPAIDLEPDTRGGAVEASPLPGRTPTPTLNLVSDDDDSGDAAGPFSDTSIVGAVDLSC